MGQLPDFYRAVITIGTFDGVHTGHRFILQQLEVAARACGGEKVIITFDPHPREVLRPQDKPVHILTTLPEKIALLEQCGIDHLVVVPFTPAFAAMSAGDYISDFLIAKFHPHTIIIGYDHRFGHNREGGLPLLEQEQAHYGYALVEIPQQVVHDLTVSSTKIRANLEAGQISLANELLGYPYFISGTVMHGDKMGRELGYPTANVQLPDARKLIPAEGIYAIRAQLPGETSWRPGVMSIGTRPTFHGTDLRLEAHLFDFQGNLYDQVIRIQFIAYLRPNRKFDDVKALIAQMDQDAAKAKEILG
ncbi:MAG TPA: bifunctional riboflavin kinase/FAD synthetase [Chitinophaga sp.]